MRRRQPENLLSDKARGLVRVDDALARVERWLRPADQIDYLIRRSLLLRVNRGATASGDRFGPPVASGLGGAVLAPRATVRGSS
jgi:hypothetical protein